MQNFVSAPHRGETRGVPTGSPNAALLIDFDNVTMGIRSDLTQQLKDLLNSDIIRGKVAVQRAYADWRRYAQYIVPLSEASVDLIFAPAYGSSKKNATDIRLAIDALELVFTRPEIGVYILLSGDSDFSSLVLKLKEYGKYVIGVGLRESASDLLVQNCDEYYSYSGLTGLTKAGEEDTVSAIDPWELVERSVDRMAEQNDVMRSDRLKQVMLDLDPSFDEAEIGYSKFNKFLAEASSRNKLALKKLGNGQYEVQPLSRGGAEQKTDGGGREERKGRGRREEPRRSRPQPPKEIEPRKPQRREERSAQKPEPKPKARERREEDLDHGYDLLKRAIRDLIDGPGEAARDSDIKRKMLELEPGWDESELGFTKFSRFLRQAHDAEVVDLQRSREGYYEARLPGGVGPSGPKREPVKREAERATQATRTAAPPKPEQKPSERQEERAERSDRGRRGTQATEAAAQKAAPSKSDQATAEPRTEKAAARGEERGRQAATPQKPKEEAAKAAPEPEPKVAPEPEPKAEAPRQEKRAASYGRRGRRGKTADGPPPLLPGQAVGGTTGAGATSGAAAAKESAPSGSAAKGAGAGEAAPSGRGSEKAEKAAPVTGAGETGPAEPAPQPGAEHGGDRREREAEKPREAPGVPAFDAEELGLPTDSGAVIRYLSNSYQGVGQKTAEALIDVFGEDRVFHGLNSQPDKVREVLGSGRRTEILLEAWERDYRRRTTAGAGDEQS